MLVLGYLLTTGLTTGALYALVALGIVVVFRGTNVVNFAHGEMFMIGGFLAWTCHVALGLSFLISMTLATGGAFLLGLLTYQIAFRPFIDLTNLNSILLAMAGISFILQAI